MPEQEFSSIHRGDLEARLYGALPIALADGEAVNLDVRGLAILTIITGAGATATYSSINSLDATEHDADTSTDVAATTKQPLTVDWPFMRVSVAGGTARIGMV